MKRDEVIGMLSKLDADQVNLKEAFIAHQEFTVKKFDEIGEYLQRIEHQTQRVETQTTKTNGRVGQHDKDLITLSDLLAKIQLKHEVEVAPLTRWKSKMGGIWFVLLLLGGGISTISLILLGFLQIMKR